MVTGKVDERSVAPKCRWHMVNSSVFEQLFVAVAPKAVVGGYVLVGGVVGGWELGMAQDVGRDPQA
jgi:hypothetical protein